MAYNEHLADRLRNELSAQKAIYRELKMMGGLCFMVDDKMCIGVIGDSLMARVDPDEMSELLDKEGAGPMKFTGRPMKGFITVEPEGIDTDNNLAFWVEQCLEFNPRAKSSKRK
jgi:TfoX/Sxy family transcriptional regulator of competence genes